MATTEHIASMQDVVSQIFRNPVKPKIHDAASDAPEAMWLVFAKSQPPASLHMARARSGIWWGKASTEDHARELVNRLYVAGVTRAWYKYEADMAPRESRQLRLARARQFDDYKASLTNPLPAVSVDLDPNRDRSSGRRTYASHFTDVGT